MDLDPRRLRVLAAIARRGSLAGAAAALHVTPSAVSQQLAQLEHSVGRPLVDRTGRRAVLTAAGRLLAARAETIERELTEAQRELEGLGGQAAGRVRVAAFSTVIRHLLVPALTLLAAEHPAVACTIVEIEGAPALRELRLGGIDLMLFERDESLGLDTRRQVTVVPLRADPYRIVVPARWPAPDSYADLADRPWVGSPASSAAGQALERIAREHGFVPRRAHSCLDFPAMLSLVAAGQGAAVVPDLALRGVDTAAIRVTALPGAGARRLDALVSSGRAGRPAVETLLAALHRVP
ncbi:MULTISPECIES: LysR family transcriptional regulator [Catenuloplanes]|uniref:Molybdate transport repressor ModE-like protein n=1 Tax=Catenuloplanes niger TaxID=587534 RepID=A0AAE3ZSP9_9ACTN|nr:LysR family transcriptional regulator [Catenuloplanes niger]MDR7324231.1 molybdate transport repressor ModE-like protein [Catenuloplanes niger]